MTSTTPALLFAAMLLAIGAGASCAWWMHRRTPLAAANLYLSWPASLAAAAGAAWTRWFPAILIGLLVLLASTAGAVMARRFKRSALGAGGELRSYEQQRLMFWRWRERDTRQRVYIATQGELVREREWPDHIQALPMTADGQARVPLGEGMHLYFVGATGAGKTTSARRWLLARGLGPTQTALLVLDPKGDVELEHDLRAVAAARSRPFVCFDPFDSATDRWNPIWAADPGAVVARLVAPVEADADSDASHYSRVLRVHLGIVAEALEAAGRWPLALPVLLRCAQRGRFERIAALARDAGVSSELWERIEDHDAALRERVTQAQLDGSLRALEVVAGQSWRRVLEPLPATGAVTLPAAMGAGAVVLWKTHVEDVKEEAETITTLALADIGAAALTLPPHAEWALLIDEFGSVLQGRAGDRAVALMQRARSSHGQIAVSTQSVSDVASATGNQQLLASLTDNFTGFVLHRQTSPESRDWLAMLLGTRELWQSTDRTTGGGTMLEGTGSRRRAAEFVVRPDEFKLLRPGEAVVWSTLGPPPAQVMVTPGPLLEAGRAHGRSIYQALPIATLTDALAGTDSTPSDVEPYGDASDLDEPTDTGTPTGGEDGTDDATQVQNRDAETGSPSPGEAGSTEASAEVFRWIHPQPGRDVATLQNPSKTRSRAAGACWGPAQDQVLPYAPSVPRRSWRRPFPSLPQPVLGGSDA